ncbi:3-hydroxyacyl-CoA dehydrogenase NAD-binding domain-containing protein [Deinococcus yavapaiensis]|uniref:Short chain enoyl-CoA hydratase /3-hydroxyacyl-CoA dehydrogenase n=1 Tax=Deinococcus yavapaiensis KR-236 TaxID=694435 RepID=A0A318SNB2_9DEIO|nr:3-hydroxyacyl-CoA dehydrogenase NAD-binding domain-containing protein [Deinococcus yavapaiensis]PYE54139.1 short chain enoyl-CoA hydratase /3-hydroxyacyl-CoA dehydrogenase [Deinococcus yavapaiensis KR-236]
MPNLVHYEQRGDIAILTIDNPPVNVFSPGVPEGIKEGLARGNADDSVKAFVLIGGERSFIAGADAKTFNLPPEQWPDMRGTIDALEASPKPVVAAMHGNALGGGLEVAMGCHFRVAAPGLSVGQPEVKLGVIPGAGGTQRLPRLIGLEQALTMIVKGDPIKADKALEFGLVDQIVEGDLLEGAIEFARTAQGTPKIRDRDVRLAIPTHVFFDVASERVQREARGLLAPMLCLEAVKYGVEHGFDAGMRREGELFMEAVNSDQSKGLRHVFFAEREVGKIPGVDRSVKSRDIATAGVLGAGTMGGGIAMNFANAGIPVVVYEANEANLQRGLATIRKNYENTAKKGRLTMEQVEERMKLIRGTLDFADLASADYVIEAVFEDMNVKKDVFGRLDATCKPGAILATNTSTLDVNEIARSTKRPGSVLGMHFFSPANVMKLLEIVRGEETSDETLVTSVGLARALRKVGVVVGVCDGFVGNRMINQYGREAQQMVDEGATPHEVDSAMHAFGLPMGPFEMSDMAGLDIGYAIRQRLAKEAGLEKSDTFMDRIVELGRKGQKTGAGVYSYANGRTPVPDPDVESLIHNYRMEKGLLKRELSRDEITKRLIYQLVNEGAKILEEGVASRAGDIDIIYVYGYGFPAYRGGPMFYADQVGLASVLADIRGFHERHGDTWKPAPLLETLAAEGKTFAQYVRASGESARP